MSRWSRWPLSFPGRLTTMDVFFAAAAGTECPLLRYRQRKPQGHRWLGPAPSDTRELVARPSCVLSAAAMAKRQNIQYSRCRCAGCAPAPIPPPKHAADRPWAEEGPGSGWGKKSLATAFVCMSSTAAVSLGFDLSTWRAALTKRAGGPRHAALHVGRGLVDGPSRRQAAGPEAGPKALSPTAQHRELGALVPLPVRCGGAQKRRARARAWERRRRAWAHARRSAHARPAPHLRRASVVPPDAAAVSRRQPGSALPTPIGAFPLSHPSAHGGDAAIMPERRAWAMRRQARENVGERTLEDVLLLLLLLLLLRPSAPASAGGTTTMMTATTAVPSPFAVRTEAAPRPPRRPWPWPCSGHCCRTGGAPQAADVPRPSRYLHDPVWSGQGSQGSQPASRIGRAPLDTAAARRCSVLSGLSVLFGAVAVRRVAVRPVAVRRVWPRPVAQAGTTPTGRATRLVTVLAQR